MITEHAHDSSKLWSVLRKRIPKKSKATVQEIKLDDESFKDNSGIANCFNKFFTSLGARLRAAFLGPPISVSRPGVPVANYKDVPDFTFKPVTVNFIHKELSSLRVNKSSGIKGIDTRILKTGCNFVAPPLTHIFNLSLQSGQILKKWKSAIVTPLLKARSFSDPTNYRPISVLAVVMKIFERAVHKQVYDHLTTNKLLSSNQSGFRSGHSTSTALLDVSDFLLKNMDNGNLIGALFIDLSKAFDLINHSILKIKLSNVGIRGQALDWFVNYLSNRTQFVTINGTLSESMDLSLCVPQGSVLGPLLFIIFINDLPTVIKRCKVVMYADDTALFIANLDRKVIEAVLQNELNIINNWFTDNELFVNCTKTKVMIFGSKQRFVRIDNPVLSLSGTSLELIYFVKYLGLLFDRAMTWHDHINAVASNVSKRLGLLNRIRKYLD